MATSFTASSRSTRRRSRPPRARLATGATLVELLVALTLAGLVAAATLSVTLSSRQMYHHDRGRVDLNQNLRIGLDLVGTNVRLAGERLPDDFPVVTIVDGGSGPDTLTLRRNLLVAVLPLCAPIGVGAAVDEVRVAWSGASPPEGCVPLADADTDGWPDNVGEWRSRRLAAGAALPLYLFDPVSRLGEFVGYDSDGTTTDFLGVSSAGTWQNGYPIDELCRAYALEQHVYQLNGDVFEYVAEGDTANPVRIIDGVVDFQARAVLSDDTVLDSFGATDDWTDLKGIEVTLTGESLVERSTTRKTLSARFFPRQVLAP